MSTNDDLQNLKQGLQNHEERLDEHDRILKGHPENDEPGLWHKVDTMHCTLFGLKNDPESGLVKEVRSLNRKVTLATGALIACEVLLKILPVLITHTATH